MAIWRCPACGREFRRGAIVTLLEAGKKPRGATVCSKCADGGMTVVTFAGGRRREVQTAGSPVDEVVRHLRVLARASKAEADKETPGSDDHAYPAGKADGYEGAVQAIQRIVQGKTT